MQFEAAPTSTGGMGGARSEPYARRSDEIQPRATLHSTSCYITKVNNSDARRPASVIAAPSSAFEAAAESHMQESRASEVVGALPARLVQLLGTPPLRPTLACCVRPSPCASRCPGLLSSALSRAGAFQPVEGTHLPADTCRVARKPEPPTLFWLTYRPTGVVVVESRGLLHARLMASLTGADQGLEFASGPQLDPESAGQVPANMIGRFLDDRDLQKLHQALLKKKPPAPSVRRRLPAPRRPPYAPTNSNHRPPGRSGLLPRHARRPGACLSHEPLQAAARVLSAERVDPAPPIVCDFDLCGNSMV
jgi:hypothetical protein